MSLLLRVADLNSVVVPPVIVTMRGDDVPRAGENSRQFFYDKQIKEFEGKVRAAVARRTPISNRLDNIEAAFEVLQSSYSSLHQPPDLSDIDAAISRLIANQLSYRQFLDEVDRAVAEIALKNRRRRRDNEAIMILMMS